MVAYLKLYIIFVTDMSILRDLSLGYTDDGKLGELVVKHNTTLKHALRCKCCFNMNKNGSNSSSEGEKIIFKKQKQRILFLDACNV